MRIGVVSDTHNHLPNVRKIVELFNEAGVDRVVHTGDITQTKVLFEFAALEAPLVGTYGNNDTHLDELSEAALEFGMEFHHPPLTLHWHNRKIMVVHDPRDFSDVLDHTYDLALHGHTHLYTCIQGEHGLMFNPGECAGMMEGYNQVGVIDLNCLGIQLLNF